MHKWIFVGSLGAVFLVTLGFSYGPGYGGNLLAFLGSGVSISPEMSPSDMVTQKKVVTFKSVTNVTTVSPLMSPLIYGDSQSLSVSPLVSPVTLRTPSVSPSPLVSPLMSRPPGEARSEGAAPSPTVTPHPATSTSQPSATPSQTPTPSPTSTPVPSSPQSVKININIANKTELMTLKGIKDVKSDAVIQYRESHGPFETIEDIMNVSGIGQVTFDGIKDYITVGP